MAGKPHIENLQNELKKFESVDLNKLRRAEIGVEGLGEQIDEFRDRILEVVVKAIEFGEYIDDNSISGLSTNLTRVKDLWNQQAMHGNNEYMAQKGQFVTNVQGQLAKIYEYRPKVVAAGVLKLGLLEPDIFRRGLSEEFGKLGAELGAMAQSEIDKIKDQANQMLEQTKQVAAQIEKRARETATGFSMKDAQDQFSLAAKQLVSKVRFWGFVSLGLTILGTVLLVIFFNEDPKTGSLFLLIYHGALRLILLGAFATALTFSLKMMRAYMHMREYNAHRQRIANSVSSFVESASTPEQRDHILSKLVDTLVTFGNSGLLTNSDDVTIPSKTIIESVTRNIPSQSKS